MEKIARLCCMLKAFVQCAHCKERLCIECIWATPCSYELAELGPNKTPMHAFRIFDA